MARKDKRKPAKAAAKASSPQNLDTTSLAAAAQSSLDGRQYKEAIELYRELLKREPRPDWQLARAEAYAGRARELAAKGMLKEALTVWRNRTEVCGTALMSGPYPAWLLQTGEMEEVVRHYRQRLARSTPGADNAELQVLEVQLAPHLLAAPEAELARFPADAPILRHRASARAALTAYAAADPQAAELIKAIPYRSPYRDLGQILKTLLILPDDPAAARSILNRLPADTAFEALAAVARSALEPVGGPWLQQVSALGTPGQRRLALSLKGFAPNRDGLLGELARIRTHGPQALLDFLLRYRTALPLETVRTLCWQLSIHAPAGAKSCLQAFGRPQPFEEKRLQALRYEQQNYLGDAIDTWQQAKSLLTRGSASGELRAALILRHLAELSPPLENAARRRIQNEILGWLAESLRHDPDDAETVVKLVAGYRRTDRLKEARGLLDDALGRFPGQVPVLLEAVELALASNAYKKAVGYARKVLELDPINGRVRSILGNAHLSHARKQIKANKPDAALKELQQAEEWLAAGPQRGRLHVLWAMATQDAGRTEETRARIAQAVGEFGGEVLAYTALNLEGAVLKLKLPPTAASTAGLSVPGSLSAEQLMAILRLLDSPQSDPKTAAAALAPLSKPLLAAASLKLPEADALYVCETLQKFDQPRLTASFAEAARRQHPQRPAFLYHLCRARFGNNPWNMSDRQIDEMAQARDLAMQQGDSRTALLIERFMGPVAIPFEDDFGEDFEDDGPSFGGPGDFPGIPSDFLGLGPEERAAMAAMIETLGEEAFLQFMKQTMPRKQFRELELEAGRENIVPMLAEMLGIDLDKIRNGSSKTRKPRGFPF